MCIFYHDIISDFQVCVAGLEKEIMTLRHDYVVRLGINNSKGMGVGNLLTVTPIPRSRSRNIRGVWLNKVTQI